MHRNQNGDLELPELMHLECNSKFRVFEPIEDFRLACPRILVVCCSPHTHPIPIPSKTPPSIRNEIFTLLESLEQDLPDLTPRRLLSHPVTQAFL